MFRVILSVIFLLFSTTLSFADEAKNVEKFVNDLGNKIIRTADNKNLTLIQKREEMIKIIDSVIDAEWISKFVLGKHYRSATAEQKLEFKDLYHEFMVQTYSPQFTGYNGEKFSITSVTKDENYYTAKCLFYPKNSEPIVNLDFRVRKNTNPKINSEFLVFDIVAEGVSLIETQRSEFGTVITNDGIDKFLKDLKARIAKLKIENAKPASKKPVKSTK